MSEQKKKLGTKNVKPSSGADSMPKTIQPGDLILKVLSVEVVPYPFEGKNKGLPEIVISMETKPITGFTGFQRVKDDPSQGNHQGQVGKVKAGTWPFSDYEGDNGVITKEEKMMSFLSDLCAALKAKEWFEAQDGVFDTVEDLVKAMNASGIYKDKWLECCIAGNKYKNKSGYWSYTLYFPRFGYKKKPFVSTEASAEEKAMLIKFDASEHVHENKKKESKTVSEFGDSNNNTGGESMGPGSDIKTGGAGDDFAF